MHQKARHPATMHVRLWQPHFVFAVLAQFLYVGAQVGTWSYFIPYVESATGVGDKAAGYMLTGTLAAFAVGRFSSAWLMRHFHARLMLVAYSVINVALCLVAVVHPSRIGVGCLLTTSLFMSIMFPTIFALGLKGMGEKTKTAGSFLVMAILGGAVLTKLMGMLPLAGGLPCSGCLLHRCCSVCLAVRRGEDRRGSLIRTSSAADIRPAIKITKTRPSGTCGGRGSAPGGMISGSKRRVGRLFVMVSTKSVTVERTVNALPLNGC